jgi:hypothetical protein
MRRQLRGIPASGRLGEQDLRPGLARSWPGLPPLPAEIAQQVGDLSIDTHQRITGEF